MQTLHTKTKDRATRTPLTTSVDLGLSAREAVPVPQLVLVVLALVFHKVININSVILVFCMHKYVNKYSSNFYCVIQVWRDDGFMYFVPHHFTILWHNKSTEIPKVIRIHKGKKYQQHNDQQERTIGQTTIYKTLCRKLKMEQHLHYCGSPHAFWKGK